MSFSWKRFLQIGKIIFPFVVLTIVFFQAKKELAGISFLEAINTIKNIPTGGVFLAITLGAFAVSTMFFYVWTIKHCAYTSSNETTKSNKSI